MTPLAFVGGFQRHLALPLFTTMPEIIDEQALLDTHNFQELSRASFEVRQVKTFCAEERLSWTIVGNGCVADPCDWYFMSGEVYLLFEGEIMIMEYSLRGRVYGRQSVDIEGGFVHMYE